MYVYIHKNKDMKILKCIHTVQCTVYMFSYNLNTYFVSLCLSLHSVVLKQFGFHITIPTLGLLLYVLSSQRGNGKFSNFYQYFICSLYIVC